MLQRAGLVEVANLERFREILPQVVRRAGLQRLAVAHHRFDRIGGIGSGEALGLRFSSGNHGNGRFVHREIGVNVEHLARFGFGFLERGVRRVPFLPEKFQRAQK